MPDSPRPLHPLLLATDLFRQLNPADVQDLESELEWVRLAEGETLFRQGDFGDSLYALIHGTLRVSVQASDGALTVVDDLEPGVTVGEMALLVGQTRSATVHATSAAALVRLSRAGFLRLSASHPPTVAALTQAILPRLQRIELAGVLRQLFGDLDKASLHALQAELVWHHYANGAVVMRQGDPGHSLFIVISGRLNVMVTDSDGTERLVGEVGRGESVGELALFTGEARAATVYAIRDTEAVELSKEAFARLLEAYPQAMLSITRLVVRRLQRVIRAPVANYTAVTFAVAPLSPQAAVTNFAEEFAQALEIYGPTLHLDADEVDQAFGKVGMAQTPDDHPASRTLSSWLDAQEARYRYIIYEADRLDSAWTSRCLQQADRVLLVALAEDGPPGPLPPAFHSLRGTNRQELVLLHPASTVRPSHTQQWLAAYGGQSPHHHVRLGVAADAHRLTRRLTGRAFGLVLGGGGARGFAHVGVLRALEEAGVAVDMVGGTSMGALVGAAYALGMDSNAMQEMARSFSSPWQLFDYTLPLVSFFAGHKVTRILQTLYGNAHIEDLWRPYFCVSTNLTQATPIVHRAGPLWKYVRASSALPGIFAPILEDGNVLVDGMLLNNLPVDVMREQCGEGTVVAVNVSLERDLTTRYQFGESVSGWQVAWSQINPFAPKVRAPSIFATLLRANEVNSVYQKRAQQRLADLTIRPPVENFASLNFAAYRDIIAIGYRAAQEALVKWPLPNR